MRTSVFLMVFIRHMKCEKSDTLCDSSYDVVRSTKYRSVKIQSKDFDRLILRKTINHGFKKGNRYDHFIC